MYDEGRSGLGMWVLAGLLILAICGVGIFGAMKMNRLEHAAGWVAEAQNITLTAIEPKEENGSDYYQLDLTLVNNSSRDIEAASYMFNARPQRGDEYAVQVWDHWEEGETIDARPCVPSGRSAQVRLVLEVEPGELESDTLELILDPYGESPIPLGTVQLP